MVKDGKIYQCCTFHNKWNYYKTSECNSCIRVEARSSSGSTVLPRDAPTPVSYAATFAVTISVIQVETEGIPTQSKWNSWEWCPTYLSSFRYKGPRDPHIPNFLFSNPSQNAPSISCILPPIFPISGYHLHFTTSHSSFSISPSCSSPRFSYKEF